MSHTTTNPRCSNSEQVEQFRKLLRSVHNKAIGLEKKLRDNEWWRNLGTRIRFPIIGK